MGYIHDVAMSQFVPPGEFFLAGGTWTPVSASSIWSYDRTAADATFWIYVPIPILSNSVASKGSYLKSIEVMYGIFTAAADDFATVSLYKDTFSADGSLNITALIASTLDTAHDTAAERKAADEHRMVVTLDTPAWIDNEEAYHLDLTIDAAATTVFKVYGALINYTLRL